MHLTNQQINDFRDTVWQYYRQAARAMPWREKPEPYLVLVSELMLQQTQVSRVVPKFEVFTAAFPTIQSLAAAPLNEVLRLWSGLGYNRRAKFLHQAAQMVVEQYNGIVPQTLDDLTKLPGVGKHTAGAILAYAFEEPVVFIETNIRTVCFYHFFPDAETVDDKELVPVIEQTLDTEHPRQWYWALMDYGTHLKQTQGNNINRSRHYTKQSTFEGSKRQLRGATLRMLIERTYSKVELEATLSDSRLPAVVLGLMQEGFIIERNGRYQLARDHHTQ